MIISNYLLVYSFKWYGLGPQEVTVKLWLLYLVKRLKLSLCSNAKHVALINYFKFQIKGSHISLFTFR